MNVKSVEKLENSTAKLVLEVEKAQFQAALDKAYRQVKNSIYIPGFRKGKAPRKIVEGMYGKEVFYEDAINVLFPEIWPDALKESELNVVGNPSIADLNVEENGNLTLTVDAGLYPEVTLGQYKGIEAEKAAVEVTEEEIDAEIKKLADRNSTVETVERPVADGDTAVIDFEGFKNGVAFEGGKGEDYSLKIGSGSFIPGFEEQLIGLSAGDEKDLDLTFPEDYGAEELAGQPVVFKVKVKEVKATNTPELDDEFAKDVSETADTLEDLRNEQKEKLLKEKTDNVDNEFKNAVMQKAIDNMTAEIPNAMVEAQLDDIMQQWSMSMQQSGFSIEQYAQMMGTNVQGVRESQRANALGQIKNTLLLEKVAEVEGIEISDEQVEEAYQQMADQYQMELEKVKEYVPAEEIVRDQKFQKAMEVITDSAVAVAPAEKTEEPAAE
ncbi:MAG: trigger factor [Oscillospiraceae bacterium]|nr:trigger factor [Oscillospiraceae bacterium]